MGVHRAVEMVFDAPGKHEEPIYTYGPLIHNPNVLTLLKKKGISVLEDIPEEEGRGTVLIRAHGVPPDTGEKLEKAGLKVIDATCPRVIKVQTIIRKHAAKGYASIIIGDRDHPEVQGLLGYAGTMGYVVDNIDALDALPAFDKAIVVAQTTQNTFFFEKVKEWAGRKFPSYKIFHTICDSTVKRQAEVEAMALATDSVIVIGGLNSGNTKRLAEIAGKSNKPVYHIESEADIDLNALASVRHVGITTGASTPGWIINKVYRTLEMLPSKTSPDWRRVFFTIERTLLLTNIYISLGAGCLCYTFTRLQGISNYFPCVLIAVLYVQSMHILNNLLRTKSDEYNDPERASFYKTHKWFLAILALMSGCAGLILACNIGGIAFPALIAMSIMGLSYNLKILPKKFTKNKYLRIRDIPGSKTVLIATAWGIVTCVFPRLTIEAGIGLQAIIVFLLSTSMVFVRTAFFDILDMQGDRIVGKESIPILMGEKKTLRVLKLVLISVCVLLLVSGFMGIITSLGFVLVICPLIMLTVLLIYKKRYMLPGTGLEFLVETNFILAGIITLVWSVF